MDDGQEEHCARMGDDSQYQAEQEADALAQQKDERLKELIKQDKKDGLNTRVADYDELPLELKLPYYADARDNCLLVYHNGVLIASQNEYMEPENVKFCKSLIWIEPLLHKVYELGKLEKQKEKNDLKNETLNKDTNIRIEVRIGDIYKLRVMISDEQVTHAINKEHMVGSLVLDAIHHIKMWRTKQ